MQTQSAMRLLVIITGSAEGALAFVEPALNRIKSKQVWASRERQTSHQDRFNSNPADRSQNADLLEI